MPGILRPDATCPLCGRTLTCLCDTTSQGGVQREYYHPDIAVPCVQVFLDFKKAHIERTMLEIASLSDKVN